MHKGPEAARSFCREFAQVAPPASDRTLLLFPPALSVTTVREALGDHGVAVGVQSIHWEAEGAFTGETSAGMAREAGAGYALVGHSERRHVFGEDDAFINEKVRAAKAFDLIPILCVGETEEQRDAERAEEVVTSQVRQGLAGVEVASADDLVIAYEPVWAIGTGRTATPEDAQAMHAHIRSVLAELWDDELAQGIRIQYGGSVKPHNVDELMAQPDIDGALVGGASLQVESFTRIVHFEA